MTPTSSTPEEHLRRAITYFQEAIDLSCPSPAQREDLTRYVKEWAVQSHDSVRLPHERLADLYPWDIDDPSPAGALVRGLFWLTPKVRVSQRIRRLYLPYRLPHPFAATLAAAAAGDVRALGAITLWRQGMAELSQSVDVGADPQDPGARAYAALLADPRLGEPKPVGDVDLRAIKGNRTRARWATDRACRGLDSQGRAAVLTYLREVLRRVPSMGDLSAELAEEGAQLYLSGLAAGLPVGFGFPGEAAPPAPGTGAFPPVLRTAGDWQALAQWREGPSRMLARVLRDGDKYAAFALLFCRIDLVRAGMAAAGASDRDMDDYRSRMRLLAHAARTNTDDVRVTLGLPADPAGRERPRPQRKLNGRPEAPLDVDDLKRELVEKEERKRRRQREVAAVLAKIDALTGLPEIKAHARAIVAKAALDERRREARLKPVTTGWHLVLAGDPGTGKTTVARLFGELFAALGVLSRGHVVEAAPADCIAEYLGQTEAKTRDLLRRAAGGVLFLDEAYGLVSSSGRNYGHDAITVLVAEMEKRRGDFVVIAAGYEREMHDFLSSNPGLRGRFSHTLHLPSMSDEQLGTVFCDLVRGHGMALDRAAQKALPEIIAAIPRGPGFANARAMRDLFEGAVLAQAQRVEGDPGAGLRRLVRADLPAVPARGSDAAIRALAALDGLIGLAGVKEKVRRIGDLARVAELQREAGMPGGRQPVGHMLFVGNPGTGKTTVARLLGQLLAAQGALPRGHVVTATRADLVGEYIGQTAIKTRKVFERAIGGVLFIDEAYSLVPGEHAGRDFGREALATLLPLMEEHAGSTVVVFAGYPADMARMVAANPGLESRIGHQVEFADYTPSELALILLDAAERDGFEVSGDALERLVTLLEAQPRGPRFGNARMALGVLAEVRARQARRLAQVSTDRAVEMVRCIVAEDVPWAS